MRRVILLLVVLAGPAAADPQASSPSRYTSGTTSGSPSSTNDPTPLSRTPTVQHFLVFDPPPPPLKSLRLEALRIAGERSEADWRFPAPEPIVGFRTDGSFFMGYPQYHPRTGRSAALHGGAAASTLLGEILLGSGLPVAGVGAMLTGATMDSAAADVDRDHESRRKH